MLHLMAMAAPSAFYQGEWLSGGYLLDFLRNQLIQTMYQRIGLRFSKRIKHLNVILPVDFQADLVGTYPGPGEGGLASNALAAAILRTLQALRKHLEALSKEVGGRFDSVWFDRMYQHTYNELAAWLDGATRRLQEAKAVAGSAVLNCWLFQSALPTSQLGHPGQARSAAPDPTHRRQLPAQCYAAPRR